MERKPVRLAIIVRLTSGFESPSQLGAQLAVINTVQQALTFAALKD